MRTKTALSYYGSSSEVAAELAAKLDDCQHVTIPFCGGLAELPYLKARAVVANDLNGNVINFYRCLKDPRDRRKLVERCKNTLSHPVDLEAAREIMRGKGAHSQVTKAWAYWCLCWVGRAGKGGTKSVGQGSPSVRYSVNGGMNATRIKAAAKDLDEWAKHFERCDFTCADWSVILGTKVKDDHRAGLLVDAPWCGAGDLYAFQFNEDDHRYLAEALSAFEKTKVVIRYGDDELIRELYPADKWDWTFREAKNQGGGKTPEVWIESRHAS